MRHVESGFAAVHFAPQPRSRPTVVRLDDESLLALLDEAGLSAMLRCIEGPAPRCELRLLAADQGPTSDSTR
ncbi:MAG: hypothetical protein FJ257_07030 [Phycisphaerae bacterium]|nr:hypothetical protein [Phycisphaerae bacterium]